MKKKNTLTREGNKPTNVSLIFLNVLNQSVYQAIVF